MGIQTLHLIKYDDDDFTVLALNCIFIIIFLKELAGEAIGSAVFGK